MRYDTRQRGVHVSALSYLPSVDPLVEYRLSSTCGQYFVFRGRRSKVSRGASDLLTFASQIHRERQLLVIRSCPERDCRTKIRHRLHKEGDSPSAPHSKPKKLAPPPLSAQSIALRSRDGSGRILPGRQEAVTPTGKFDQHPAPPADTVPVFIDINLRWCHFTYAPGRPRRGA